MVSLQKLESPCSLMWQVQYCCYCPSMDSDLVCQGQALSRRPNTILCTQQEGTWLATLLAGTDGY